MYVAGEHLLFLCEIRATISSFCSYESKVEHLGDYQPINLPLNANHTHFLLVDDGLAGGKYSQSMLDGFEARLLEAFDVSGAS